MATKYPFNVIESIYGAPYDVPFIADEKETTVAVETVIEIITNSRFNDGERYPMMKDMIMMRYKDGKTHAEIGELLGVSEEQVYHTCARFFRRARHPQYARALRKYNERAPFEEN